VAVAVAGSSSSAAGAAGRLAVRRWREVAGGPGASKRTLLGLVREAGNPYCDWFFGGEKQARTALARWLERPSSELSGDRVTVLAHGTRMAGIFVALSGVELEVCRKADTLAALVEAGEERPAFLKRISAARRLFLPVRDDSFYLSRIAVVPRLRCRGIGGRVMVEFLRHGRSEGFRRFDLDVAADNEAAIRLYKSFGFRVEATRRSVGMRYIRMVLLDDWPY
jgi:ribosomal protein S18 acetylase RimI-like enzyme